MGTVTGAIAGALQNGYGDATQTVLDHKVARDVETAMLNAGWFSPEQVAIIVAAAGGRVEIDDALMMSPPKGVRAWRREDTRTMVVESF